MARPRIRAAVVGAGIIGLTAAEQMGWYADVTVVEGTRPPVSNLAAAFVMPFLSPQNAKNVDISSAQFKGTYSTYGRLLQDEAYKHCVHAGWCYRLNEDCSDQYWHSTVDGRYVVNPLQPVLQSVKGAAALPVYQFPTYVIDPPAFMQALRARLGSSGVHFIERHLTSLCELYEEEYDVVVNCTGLGAKELVDDPDVHARKGVLLKYDISLFPDSREFTPRVIIREDATDKLAYIVVHPRHLILGGTSQLSYATEVYDCQVSSILEQVDKLDMDPQLRVIVDQITKQNIPPSDKWAGGRPCRTGGVRVEEDRSFSMEQAQANNKRKPLVIHNYGHGGSGWSLCWGCAAQVDEMVRQHFGATHSFESKVQKQLPQEAEEYILVQLKPLAAVPHA